MKKSTAFLFLFYFFQHYCFCQTIPALTLTQVSKNNGLSDNKVQCILKDKIGLLWIGTEDGLNVMDGSTVKKILHEAGSATSILSDNILSLAEDNQGNIWVGTSKGLCSYQKNKQHFFSVLFPANEFGNTAIVNSIAVTKTNQLWCGTEGGLFLYDIATKKITQFPNLKSNAINNNRHCNNISKLLLDSDKTIWLCSKDGFWKFDSDKKEFKKITGQAESNEYNPQCLCVFESSDKKLWIGNRQFGLQQVDKQKDSVMAFYHTLPGAVENVSCINEVALPESKYVLLLNGDLQAFNPFANKFLQLPKPISLQQYPNIETIHRSDDGWLWLGSSNNGLFIANPQSQYFHHHFFDGNGGAQSVIINEWNNQLLIGGEGKNLLKMYDSSWNTITDFYDHIFPSPANTEAFSILSLVKENANNWWLGTSTGLIRINPTTYGRRWFTAKKRDSLGLPNNVIGYTFFDKEKQLWLFPKLEGVWKMDVASRKITHVLTGLGNKEKFNVAAAAEDAEGNIWMACLDEGIIFYEKKSGVFSKPFEKELGEKPNNKTLYFEAGFLYSFSGNTILKWKNKASLQKIILPFGLSKELYDMALDKKGNCWIADKSGLILYNEQLHFFKKFTTTDGLNSNYMNGRLFCRSNGDMVFASADYLTSFSPAQIIGSNSPAQKVLLTGVYVNDSLIEQRNGSAEFDFQQNNLLFQWALPSFSNPFANNYYCQLKGIDSTWRFVGNKGEIQFAHLAPGNYTLLMKATSANGLPSANSISYQFTILATYWHRPWVLISAISLFLLVIFLLVRSSIRNIKRKSTFQQEIKDLEMKALKMQLHPNFIADNLKNIQQTIATNEIEIAEQYLNAFSQYVQRIAENAGKLTVPVAEEMEMMRLYLNLERCRFPHEFSFNIQNKFSNQEFDIPIMLTQPFIDNALWHGLLSKQGERKIQVLVFETKKLLNISIEDNGIGRKAATGLPLQGGNTGKGLALAKERLEHFSYGASIEMFDLTDANGDAAGTKVIIRLPNY